jgi:hypothetical protein
MSTTICGHAGFSWIEPAYTNTLLRTDIRNQIIVNSDYAVLVHMDTRRRHLSECCHNEVGLSGNATLPANRCSFSGCHKCEGFDGEVWSSKLHPGRKLTQTK